MSTCIMYYGKLQCLTWYLLHFTQIAFSNLSALFLYHFLPTNTVSLTFSMKCHHHHHNHIHFNCEPGL